MAVADTFDDQRTRAVLGTRGEGPNDQTIRPDPSVRSSLGTLPHLTIGEWSPDPLATGPDLRVRGELGAGGMGVVYLARQASLGRDVAIKQVREDAPVHAGDALLREARFMGGLEHPNIVPVHALGVDERGRPVLVMKRIEGVAWRALIREPEHPWWASQAGVDRLVRHVQVLESVCHAVEFAHARGVLHRDLKPDNVMIGAFGEVYLMDWGIAHTLEEPRRGVVGTPAYMAPEMVDPDAAIDRATDVYLLGACLHEVLTGRPRHHGDTVIDVMRAAHESPPVDYDVEVPREIAAIANQACARAPAERYPTAEALRRALVEFQRHRAADALAGAARVSVKRLSVLLAGDGQPAAVEACFAEARFGLRQASEQNPGGGARGELVALLSTMAPYRIARGDLDAADVLVDELAALGAEPADLRASIAGARAEAVRLRDLADDMDLGRFAGMRAIGAALLLVTFTALTVYVMWSTSRDASAYDHLAAVRLICFSAALTWTGLLAGRRYAFANAVNRTLSTLALGIPLAILANRLLALRFGVPLPAMLAVDLLLISLGFIGGIALHGPLAWAALPGVLGATAIAIAPQHFMEIFGLSGIAGLAVFGIVAWRAAAR